MERFSQHPLEQGVEHHPEALGSLEDIEALTKVMNDIDGLEEKLSTALSTYGSSVNEECIEIKVSVKPLMSLLCLGEGREDRVGGYASTPRRFYGGCTPCDCL